MDSVAFWLIEGSAKRKSTNQLSEIVDHWDGIPKNSKWMSSEQGSYRRERALLEPPENWNVIAIGALSDLIGLRTTR
jgi:hypothetical protein